MSFNAVEISQHSGSPIELYEFYTTTHAWRYTSADTSVAYLGYTYTAHPVQRGSFKQTREILKAGLEVRMPRDSTLVADQIASPLIGMMRLSIYRKHIGDDEFKLWWAGRVNGTRFEGNEAVIACSPHTSSLSRYGVRRPAQRMCPHAIYDAGCGLVEGVVGTACVALAITGSTLSAAELSSKPDGWWVGGKVRFGSSARMVVAHTGQVVTLSSPIVGLLPFGAFTVYPGCDHTPGTCDTKFSNIANYGGAPWLPIKSPFSGDSAF